MVDLIKAAIDNDSIIKNSLQEQSYEMSPYRSDDDVPNNKFMPSWARFVTVQVFVAYPLNNVMVPSLNVTFRVFNLSWRMCFCGAFFYSNCNKKNKLNKCFKSNMWLAPIILIVQNRYPCLGSGNNAADRFTIA